VPLHEIVEARNKLPLGSFPRLLLAVYTEIPPVRRDLHDTPVFVAPGDADLQKRHASTGGNYIVIDRENSRLVLQEYKTAKVYGENVIPLTAPLMREITQSFQRYPRRHLFVSTKDFVTPYGNERTFGQWANATLHKIFGKPLTLTMLRHVYVTALDFNSLTKRDRMTIASNMGHGLSRQEEYRFVFRDPQQGAQLKLCKCSDA
jgi:hypothetical protein